MVMELLCCHSYFDKEFRWQKIEGTVLAQFCLKVLPYKAVLISCVPSWKRRASFPSIPAHEVRPTKINNTDLAPIGLRLWSHNMLPRELSSFGADLASISSSVQHNLRICVFSRSRIQPSGWKHENLNSDPQDSWEKLNSPAVGEDRL